MNKVYCVAVTVFLSLFCAAAPEKTAMSVDFASGKWKAVNAAEGRAAGELPEGWTDDTSWCRAWSNYSHETFQGSDFLRIAIRRIEQGRHQLARRGIGVAPKEGAAYRLRLKLRGTPGHVVNCGLRMDRDPWKFHWEKDITLTGEWREYDFQIRLAPAQEIPMGFYMTSLSAGEIDLGRFELEAILFSALAGEARRRYPDGGPANLMRNTVFPLGMQNGWALDRDISDGDEVAVEPAGEALRWSSSDHFLRVTAEPFRTLVPDSAHKVRMEVRGSGRWSFRVRSSGQTLAQESRQLEPDRWDVVELPFRSSLFSPVCQAQFSGQGVLELRSVAAGPAGKVESFQPGAQPQVALALPESETAAARIQFAGEPALVRFRTVAAPEGAELKSVVCDLSGNLRPAVREGETLRFLENPAELGSFRIEAWLERDGKPVSPVNELVVHRMRRPRFWGGDAPDSPFGIHTSSAARNLLMAKASGFNWVRLHDAGLQYIGWYNLEKQPGQWTFFDDAIRRYRDHNLMILGEAGTAPEWASFQKDTVRSGKSEYFDKFFQPKNLDDYVRYVDTVSKRYAGVITAWDVWNEPWIHAWWAVGYDPAKNGRDGYRTSSDPAGDFVRMTEHAHRTLKANDSGLTVLGFNTTTDSNVDSPGRFNGADWTRWNQERGAEKFCDAVAIHCYVSGPVGFPGDAADKGISGSLEVLRHPDGGWRQPVWMTEGSAVTNLLRNGIYRHSGGDGEPDRVEEISDRTARYLLTLLSRRIDKFFLYSMHSYTGEIGDSGAQWRFLTNDDGYLHPSAVAVSNLAWLVEGLRPLGMEKVAPGVWAHLFSDGARTLAAVAGEPGAAAVSFEGMPAGVEAFDLFGNPAKAPVAYSGRVVYLYGNIAPEALSDFLKQQRKF